MHFFPKKTAQLAAALLLCLPVMANASQIDSQKSEPVQIKTIALQSQLAGFGAGVEVSRVSQYLAAVHGLDVLQTQAFKDVSSQVLLEGGLTIYGASPVEDFTKISESYGKRGSPVQFHYHPAEKRVVIDRRDLKKADAAVIIHRDFAAFRTQTSLVEPTGYKKEAGVEIEVAAVAPAKHSSVLKKDTVQEPTAQPTVTASVDAPAPVVAPAKNQVHFHIGAKERLSVALDRFLAEEGYSLRWEAKGLDMESTTDSMLSADTLAELVNQVLKGTGLVGEIYTPSKLVLIKQHPVSNLK